jgi:acetyl esterase/lipase
VLALLIAISVSACSRTEAEPARHFQLTGTVAGIELWHRSPARPLSAPCSRSRPVPVIVFLHGGGWSGGTPTTGPDFKRYFARDGFAMASIEYRLTPTVTIPANVEDVRTAVRWLKANASAQGVDPDRIGLWGTSAGGHLAAVAALAARGTFEGSDHPNQSSAVRCVLDAYGPTRFDRMDTMTAFTASTWPRMKHPFASTPGGSAFRPIGSPRCGG